MRYGAPYRILTRNNFFETDFETEFSDNDNEEPEGGFIGAIHSAAAFGLPDLIRTMVQKAASREGDWATYPKPEGSTDIVNQSSEHGYPLHFAVCSRSKVRETITTLVQLGADMDSKQRLTELTPLFLAVERGDWKAARTLLDLGADPDPPRAHLESKSLLFRAIYSIAHRNALRCDEDKEPWLNARGDVIRRLVQLGFDLEEIG